MVQRRLYKTNAEKQRAYRKTKKPYFAKRAAIRAQLNDPAVQALKAIQGVYDVVIIDPPWPVAFQHREERPNQVSLSYVTMSVEAIKALHLPLADVAHVWLWTTQRFLPEALHCLTAWQLDFVCQFVWIKGGGMQPIGLPQFDSEFALYARKGEAQFVDTKDFRVCFKAPRGAHSEKPEEFYATVRRVTAGRRLDMFGRRAIQGFDSWGYEAPQGE